MINQYQCYDVCMSKLSLFIELWHFILVRKKWMLLPLLIILALFSLLMIFAQTSPVAPFIYTFI